jgi:hypothetical protein
MALIAAAGRRDAFPCVEHGAAAESQTKGRRSKDDKQFHD